MPRPDISIIMSVYNGDRYLSACLESILSQTEQNFEFIIINDGSYDATTDILNACNDSRLRIFKQANSGLTKSLNRGLEIAQGKYIARIDADDQAEQKRLKRQKQFLDNNPDIALVGSNALLIDEIGETIGKTNLPLSHHELMINLEAFKPVFVHSSIFFRREEIIKAGGYNERFIKSQDSDLYLRLSQLYKLTNLKEPLVKLRVSIDSVSYNPDNNQKIMGLAALINHYRRKKGFEDFSTGDELQWQGFLEKLDAWFIEKNFHKKAEAKKWFRNTRTLIHKRKYFTALESLYHSFKKDKLFWAYKDIGIKIPEDLNKFIVT